MGKGEERDVSPLEERDAFRDEIERHLEAIVWLQQLEPPQLLHVSPTYEAVWGRPAPALHKDDRVWLESVLPEDRARVAAAFERMLGGAPFDEEYRIRRPNGEVRWIHSRGTPFDDGRGRLDRAAGIAEDVTERKRTAAALERAERRRREAARAAERAEDRERRALARDLHDAVSQTLALAHTKLVALRQQADGASWASQVAEIELLVAEADERTRTLTFRLSPPVLHDLGLAAAAEWLAEDLERRFDLHVSVSDAGLEEPLPTEVREALFRSLRELLINVVRHAKTHRANVELATRDDQVEIAVSDGGVGFDPAEVTAGFGQVSIRERLESLGGHLKIDSQPGRGTAARMIVPLGSAG